VVAAFIRASGHPTTADDLRANCRERLAPPYKAPVHWRFLEAFPLTPSGKVQKYRLRYELT